MEMMTQQTQGGSGLFRSDVEFRRLLEKLPAAAYTCDAEGLITYFNRRAVDLWGREPKLNDPVDRFCGSFRLFSPDGAPISHDRCWMALALRDAQEYNGHEIVVERPDGSRLTALAHANPIHDDAGRVIAAVNVLVDITDRKQIEEMLRDAARRKDEFLAMLAHELRNPLAPIRSGLELLAVEAGGRHEAVELMQQQVSHLVRLVDDLLDVSRIMRGRIELRREPVELSTILRRSVNAVRSAIEGRGQEMAVSIPPDGVWLDADPVRLVQVVENLLTNASKYTDAGGRIELSSECRDGQAVIGVQDNGMGIEPDLLPKVFDLFMQASRALDRSQGGLGIGLTLVRRLVELHGGSVAAHSEGPGKGSRFEVRLPVAQRAAKVAPRPAASNPLEGRRILVVDDNVGAAKMLSLLVSRLGPHEVEMAHDGPSAIDKAVQFQPDIILLDIGLPKMDGLEVARRLCADGHKNGTLLVALTGYGHETDRQKSRQAGFDEHLVKPVDIETLRQMLQHPRLCPF